MQLTKLSLHQILEAFLLQKKGFKRASSGLADPILKSPGVKNLGNIVEEVKYAKVPEKK